MEVMYLVILGIVLVAAFGAYISYKDEHRNKHEKSTPDDEPSIRIELFRGEDLKQHTK